MAEEELKTRMIYVQHSMFGDLFWGEYVERAVTRVKTEGVNV